MRQPGQWGLHAEAGGGSRALVQGTGARPEFGRVGGRRTGFPPCCCPSFPSSLSFSPSLPSSLLFFSFFPSFLPRYLSRTQHAPGTVPDPGERVPVPLSSPGEGNKSFIPNNHTQRQAVGSRDALRIWWGGQGDQRRSPGRTGCFC